MEKKPWIQPNKKTLGENQVEKSSGDNVSKIQGGILVRPPPTTYICEVWGLKTTRGRDDDSVAVPLHHILVGDCHTASLKGPKLETFGSKVFTRIRPVWVGDLGTRPKNLNILLI
jgi:hypothetical protein